MAFATPTKGCRIGIDVGGTFTDFVLANGETGALVRYKEPSVPDDPSMSVARGLPALMERAGVAPSDVSLIVHGTTLALNAIIQRRGAKLGLVVSRGNRSILEIARNQLANAFSFDLQKEEPLVPRKLVMESSARLLVDGTVHADFDDAEVEAIAATYRKAKVDAVTVLLLHAYANPAFEKRLADALAAKLPGIPVTASSSIWPEQREYERCLVALLNSYVQPIMDSYLERLQERVGGLGIDAPIYITANNGGTLSLATARARPIDTILSGPASGVVAASVTARPTGRREYVTIDMGGTSADMSVIQGGEPENTTRTHVGDLPIIVPVVNVSAIGAGGGSIVWVDAHGVLKVGPKSAGAAPGPVCYGRGGTRPTVTDCYLVAGLIDEAHFLGGRMQLDRPAAVAALEAIADKLGIAGDDRARKAAESTLRVTSALMATEMTKTIAQRGEDIRDYALVPFGGAGPTQANFIADDCNIGMVIVPPAPSTFCALGAILSDVKRDYVLTKFVNFTAPGAADEIRTVFQDLEAQASDWIASEGSIMSGSRFEHVLDMRYGGQAYELPITLTPELRETMDLDALAELYHQAHERTYNFRDLDTHVELTTIRLRVVGEVPPITIPTAGEAGTATSRGSRPLYWDGAAQDAAIYLRSELGTGAALAGPAIVEQEDTTIIILAGWKGGIDGAGNLIIERASP